MLADMHCDTIWRIFSGECKNIFDEKLAVNINGLIKSNYAVQNFALFIDAALTSDPYTTCHEMCDCFMNQIELAKKKISQVRTAAEIEDNIKNNKLSAFLTIEEGAVCKGNPELLKEFYDRGVRMMTLTWNYENEIGSPNCIIDKKGRRKPFENSEKGLKKAGFEIIEAMEDMGMIVDVSHLSDKGFFDVASKLKGPFVASHSNCRDICRHPRNLTDEMIRCLGEHGGVSGLNLYGSFVNPQFDAGFTEGHIEDLMKHAHHMADTGGIECVALGTDFDGFEGNTEPDNSGDMIILSDALSKSGFTSDEIDKITYKNVLRVYKECLNR